MKCKRCGAVVVVDEREGLHRLVYSHEDWQRLCMYRDAEGLATCPEMIGRIRATMLPRAPNGHVDD